MKIATIIGVLLVVCLVITACGKTTKSDQEETDEPEFSLEFENEDLDLDGLDDLNLDGLDNLL